MNGNKNSREQRFVSSWQLLSHSRLSALECFSQGGSLCRRHAVIRGDFAPSQHSKPRLLVFAVLGRLGHLGLKTPSTRRSAQ